MFLADELNVTELAEVEVTLFLQPIYRQLQVQELQGQRGLLLGQGIPASEPLTRWASSSSSLGPGWWQLTSLTPSPLACWLSSRIWASVSWPPLRAAGGFFRRMQGGATLLSRPEVCMFLGPVGDVLCGTAQRTGRGT